MRARSADERLLTDVCFPPPAPRIGIKFLYRPTKSAGDAICSDTLSAIMRVVELPKDEASKPGADRIGEAFANYFRGRAEAAECDLRELFRLGWRSLLIGLIVLAACLSGSQLVAAKIKNMMAARVLEESLIIVGWVANWRPIEIYLYDWWPIRRRIALFHHIASAPLAIRPI